ncbi:hypothetical protein C0966_12360 [Bacillus methanolicus]|uniref:hypothetical protein n=1 Tax=Bacillus methanolicus TaxID=1471 RepID=UPI0023802108|nr:hypothetical protein [Bacillus methanolicus]MDE3840140.1 hypothetical protein [Bacillus methanolicus]
MNSKKCPNCFNGYILDPNFSEYQRVDEEIDKLFDGGQFSYYEAFGYVTRKYLGSKKKCGVCNGTGQKPVDR